MWAVLQLRAFAPADEDPLISWFPDGEALQQWAGPGPTWPLDHRQLTRRRAESGVQAWTAYLDGVPSEPAGHIELIRTGPRTGRIDRVALAPAHRGRGLGAILVRAALDHARANGLRTVDLLVFAANQPAVRTYLAVGFTDAGSISPDYPAVRRMVLDLEGE